MNRKGITAVPIALFRVAAKLAENPVMNRYATNIPMREMKNDGRRPSLSVLILAVTENSKFQRAFMSDGKIGPHQDQH